MKVAIVGTRGFNDFTLFEETVRKSVSEKDIIVTGDAPGADQLARVYAKRHGLPCMVFVARWKEFGLKAGPLRNREIVEVAERMIVFWDMKSKGTYDAIQRAKRKGIPLEVVEWNDE